MQPVKPTINKITSPVISDIYPRARLFRSMDNALEKPIVWIQGSAGSGKTTLIASYLESRNLPHIWYQIDEGDADCATLFYYMGLAVNKADPQIREPLPLFTAEYRDSILLFTRRFFEILFSRLTPPCVLVLDNYHEVAAASQFHEVLRCALEEIPPGFNVILSSREVPHASLARHRSRRRMGFISGDEFLMDSGELHGLVQMRHADENAGSVELLLEKTKGWLAGVVLMLERGLSQEMPLGLADQTPEAIGDFFSYEVFDGLEKPVQDFFLKTAFMKSFTPQMAYDLTGNSAAGTILADMNRKNFFTEKYYSPELMYQYHPMFRAFLRQKSLAVYPDTHLDRIRPVAGILMEHGQIENAAELFIESRDWAGLEKLVRREAVNIISQGRGATLGVWIEAIPPDIVMTNPWFQFWKGACLFGSNLKEARGLFENAFALFKAEQDAPGIYLAWSGIVNCLHNEMEGWQVLDHWIAELDELLPRYPVFPSPQVETRLALSMFTSLVLRQTDHRRIGEWGNRLFALLETSANHVLRMKALNSMLLHYLWRGEYAKMRLLFDSAVDKIVRQQDASPLEIITLNTTKAFYYWVTAQPELCRQIIGEALETAGRTGMRLMDTRLRICLAQADLVENDAVLYERCWQELKTFYPQDNKLNETNYHFCSAMLAMQKNNVARAASHLEEAAALALKTGSYFHICLCHIGTAQVFLAQAKAAEALRHLAAAGELSLRIKSSTLEYMCRLTTAAVLFRQGNEETGLEALRGAMALGREHDYQYGMWWDFRMIASLCVKALAAGIEVTYVRQLVRRRRLMPDEIPLDCNDWPWPIRISTLGEFRIEIDGRPLKFSGKVPKKPIELLKALIALGGTERSEGELADLLWPEVDGDTAKNSFKITLHRLRQMIGSEDAVYLRKGKLVMDPRLAWSDAAAFGKLLAAAQMQGEAGAEAEAVRLTGKALALYRGHFLEGENDKRWAAAPRARLKSKFVLNTVALGNLYQNRGERKKALDCYLRGLEVEPHAEELYQNLIQMNLANGLRAEAISVYRDCRLALAELGLAPSSRTEAIYRAVKGE